MKIRQYIAIAIMIFAACSSALANDSETYDQEQKLIDVLRSEAGLFDKVQAFRSLGRMATSGAVEALSSFLCDESLGDYARFALEAIEGAAVDQAFREALDDCQTDMQIGLINSIGVRRDSQSVSQLSKLVRDPDSRAAAEAIAALGKIATDQAIETIVNTMNTGSKKLRLAAAHAGLSSAGQLLNMNDRQNALKLYTAIGKADVPKRLHAAAAYGEILARGSNGLPLLVEHLKNDDPAMIAVAIGAARELPGTKVSQKLAKELSKLPSKTQVLLIKVMVDRNDPAVLKSIQALVASKDPDVRVESLKALGQIGNVSSAAVLLKASDAGGSDAGIARDSLRILDSEGVDETIIGYMKKTTSDAKAKLIEVLSDRDAAVALDEIFSATKDKDTNVQRAAFKAVGKLTPAEDVVRVIDLLESIENDAVRREAERAVISVLRKMPEDPEWTDAVIKAFDRKKNVNTRCSFIRIMASFEDAKSFQVIKSALKDKDEQVQDAAVRAIAAWPDTEAMSTLLNIFKGTDNNIHRVVALRGYIRLVRRDKQIAATKKAEILGQIMFEIETAAEKKNVLSGLGSVQHLSAMTIASKYISDPEVKDEAMLATIQIAQSIAGTRPDQVKQVALEIEKTTSNDAIRKQAETLVKTIESFGDFITAWQVSEQYLKDGKNYSQLFDIQFAPETGDNVEWSLLPAGTNPAQPWLLDLDKLYPSNTNQVAYAYTWIHSESLQTAGLELGSDDGVKVWLNGEIVHANNTAGGVVPGSDNVKVQLEKGWNKLMLKVTQNNGEWGFCARLREPSGNKLEGIEIDCLHQ